MGPAYLALARAYAELGEPEKANAIVSDSDVVLQWSQKYVRYQGLIAEINVMSGQPEAAIDRLAQAMRDGVYYSPALLRLDPIGSR
jgi:hypothetical protein